MRGRSALTRHACGLARWEAPWDRGPLCQEEGQTWPSCGPEGGPCTVPTLAPSPTPTPGCRARGGGGGEQVWAPSKFIREPQEAENSRSCLPSEGKGVERAGRSCRPSSGGAGAVGPTQAWHPGTSCRPGAAPWPGTPTGSHQRGGASEPQHILKGCQGFSEVTSSSGRAAHTSSGSVILPRGCFGTCGGE